MAVAIDAAALAIDSDDVIAPVDVVEAAASPDKDRKSVV
jgi:hypothetical protein